MKVVNTNGREYPVIGVSIALDSGEIIKVHPDSLMKDSSEYLPDGINGLLDMLNGNSQCHSYSDTALFNKKSVNIVSLDIIVSNKEEFNEMRTVPMDDKIQYLIIKRSPLEGEEIRKEAIDKMKWSFEKPYYSRRINDILGLNSIKDIVEFCIKTTPDKMGKIQGIGRQTREKMYDLYYSYENAYDYVYGE